MYAKAGNGSPDLKPASKEPLQLIDGKMRTGWTRKDLDLYLALGMEPPVLEKAGETPEMRAGSPCPKCGQVKLEYNGLLNLACKNCGYTLGGCFT